MPELTDLSLLEAAHALREGEFSSRELVQACLERIEILDPHLRTFISLAADDAMTQAGQADLRIKKGRGKLGRALPPLLGVPVAIKDVLSVKDLPCTCGSRILENYIPPFTATAVQRLLTAGMIVLGKTNTDEFAMGSSTENSSYFTTHNPWNLEHVPGGSSGGSAAAVAARLVPAALGTDTGGSVRQPASYCGITGIKPTYGRVSRYGLVAFGSSLDTVGAFARNAADAGFLFQMMAGVDELDATSVDIPVPPLDSLWSGIAGNRSPSAFEPSLKGLRVGVPAEYFIEGIQAEVEAAVWAAIRQLESLGAEIVSISLPHTEYALPVYYLIAPAEASANLARYDGVRYGPRMPADDMWEVFFETRGAKFGQEVKRRIMLGTYALSAGYYDAYYGQAQKVRTLIKRDFEIAFERVHVIAAPVAPSTAFRIGEHSGDPLSMYLEDVFTLPANLGGVPGITFPVGFDTQGLPVGMQLMGPHFGEERLFETVHAYQQVSDWHSRKPDLGVVI
jgi:aspartyl-tRNA(Asn)/glutamyl-tRNA(Gln) amidotransferase subunit A